MTVKGFVDRVVIVAGGRVVATHGRSPEHATLILDPLHFLATLDRKPGRWTTRRSFANGSCRPASPTSGAGWSVGTASGPGPVSTPGSCNCSPSIP